MSNRNTALESLPWGLILGLGALQLVRPLMSMVGALDAMGKPWSPVAVTVIIAIIWIGVVVAKRVAQPVLTLAFAGIAYGIFAVALNLIGTMFGAQSMAAAGILGTLLFNGLLGLVLGLIALGLLKLRK
ncbi:hypothetical protein [Amycolatopsis aidingensis]|uniref:hypothetical protein n=1 Tax=Amycolatopsis aidingensis TaxID=2842453 RepID=UPI001C0D0CB9|nr:hypothetical protein [Amycolatopsis aidingensis]